MRLRAATRVAGVLLGLTPLLSLSQSLPPHQNWTHYVRIGAWSLDRNNAERIVREAEQSHVFGIEVDNDIPGRYESFLHPEEKLAAIRAVAEHAHKAGNYAYVYIAGLECITANADQSPHSLAKDHPDWLQRKITGEPAVFGGGDAFWIAKGDEDVWISPYAPEWRKLYMERVRQIAATGIDGVYVDVPYWMTHFDGWEDSWTSFDDYTVAAFKQQTSLDAKRDFKLGDFYDANFRRWVDFRIQTVTDFMHEIDHTAKAVNPKIKTIPEFSPGIDEEVVRTGADAYSLYAVNDAIAHEYEFGGGDHMASSRTPLDWFRYQVGMASFRAFAQGKATWILNYSWDGDKKVDPREAMQNLFMSEVMAGANVWDAATHVMSGSNDIATRTRVFAWVAAHEKTFYRPRTPMHPVGVYFSPATRNYFAREFVASYQGVLILLMQQHLEYQVVTPRTLGAFQGKTLVLPDVRVLDDDERKTMSSYLRNGGHLVVTGQDATGMSENYPGDRKIARFAECPGRAYLAALEKDFAGAEAKVPVKFMEVLSVDRSLRVEASAQIATHIASVDGKPHIFFANFKGLQGGVNPVQEVDSGARIIEKGSARAWFLPFMGEVREVPGVIQDGTTTFSLPPIGRGAVVWLDAVRDTNSK